MPAQDLKNALNLLDSGQPHRAIALLEILVDRMPGYTAAHTILARAYEAAAEWNAARAAWEHARFLMPNSPVVRAGLQRAREQATAQVAASDEAPPLDLDAFDALLAGSLKDTPEDDTDEAALDFETLDAVLDDLGSTQEGTEPDLRAQAAAALAAAQAEDDFLAEEPEPPPTDEPVLDDLELQDAAPGATFEESDQLREERPRQEVRASSEESLEEASAEAEALEEHEPELSETLPADEVVEEPAEEQPPGTTAGDEVVADEAVETISDDPFLEAPTDEEPAAEEPIAEPPALSAPFDEDVAEEEAVDEDVLGLSEWEEFESEAEAAKSPAAADEIDDLDRLIEELESARIVPAPELDDVPSIELDDDIDDVVSETLARIYASQQQYDEAARVYEQLARQQPDQAEHFLQKAAEMSARGSGGAT